MRIHLTTAFPSGRPREYCHSQLAAVKGDPHQAGMRSETNLDGREVVGEGREGEDGCVGKVRGVPQVGLEVPVGQQDGYVGYEAVGAAAGVDELQVHQEEERRAGRQRVARGRRRRHVEALPQTVEACPVDSLPAHAATFRSPCPCPGGSALA